MRLPRLKTRPASRDAYTTSKDTTVARHLSVSQDAPSVSTDGCSCSCVHVFLSSDVWLPSDVRVCAAYVQRVPLRPCALRHTSWPSTHDGWNPQRRLLLLALGLRFFRNWLIILNVLVLLLKLALLLAQRLLLLRPQQDRESVKRGRAHAVIHAMCIRAMCRGCRQWGACCGSEVRSAGGGVRTAGGGASVVGNGARAVWCRGGAEVQEVRRCARCRACLLVQDELEHRIDLHRHLVGGGHIAVVELAVGTGALCAPRELRSRAR